MVVIPRSLPPHLCRPDRNSSGKLAAGNPVRCLAFRNETPPTRPLPCPIRIERAILATAQRLIEQRPLADISVDDLAKGAGICRPTFYFYFASKDAVLLTLLEQMIAEAVRGPLAQPVYRNAWLLLVD